MKILITSDNHIGYKEKDPYLGDDTFTTFEEILKLTKDVDIMIQGGDLFHNTCPSKNTLNKVINLLKNYCTGGERTDVRSSDVRNFNQTNLNISLPVFAIHGNHDDPSGYNSVSAIEILESTGLINYISKHTDIERINVVPSFVSKNNIRVAIYGISYINDRRLYKNFEEGRVTFDDAIGCFKILVIHQNRVRHGDYDYIPPHLIPDMFDLVIYGHEHESMYFDIENKFSVIQCGSTVRTSCSESETGDKYVYFLDFTSDPRYPTITRERLNTVRDIALATFRAQKNSSEADLDIFIEALILGKLLPIVKIKVETESDFINRFKYGLKFQDRVANYKDMIRIVSIKNRVVLDFINKDRQDIYDIISTNLQDPQSNESILGIISGAEFCNHLRDFAIKKDKNAFKSLLQKSVLNISENIDRTLLDPDDFRCMVKRIKENIEDVNRNKDTNIDLTRITETDNSLLEFTKYL